jgi:hypothetical protein
MSGGESRQTADAKIDRGRSGEPAATRARDRAGAKTAARRASVSDAGDGAKATAAQSGEPGGAAAQAEDPSAAAQSGGAAETADPVATGAQASEDSSGVLPFTGFGVSLLVTLGLIGLAGGLLLRRLGRRVTRAGA